MYAEKPLLHARQRQHRPGQLRTIALDVTPRCNMHCAHCYAETFVDAEPIELDILAKALEQFYDLGVYHYVLQGGEPITQPERLERIVRLCHPDETYLNVVSNGWAMTRDKVRWLREIKVDKVTFSMDSGIEAEHDASRVPGSFQRVLRGIDYVLEVGLLASVSVVVSHQSLHSRGFQLAYEFAERKGIRIDVQIAEPVGKWDGRTDLLITPEDAAHIKMLREKAPILKNGLNMVNRDVYCGDRDHCPAGSEFMGLTADGQLLPCNFLQFSLGSIRHRTVAEMRAAIMERRWFQGASPLCLCGEDREFIDAFIVPFVDRPKPLDAFQVFGLRGNGDSSR